jgi:hypothetical protein
MKFTVRLLGLLAGIASNIAFCTPITFSFAGTATGTLGGTAFNDASFTVTSLADTAVVSLVGSTYQVQAITSSINISGFPSATFIGATFWRDPQGSGDIIFGNISSGLLGITSLFVGLEAYDLKSSIGPIFSATDFESSIFHNFQNVPTSQGSLTLIASNETFTASVAPEPLSMLLAGLGLTVLLSHRLRQNSQ